MTVTLHDGTVGKLFGCVKYLGLKFHPEIVVAGDRLEITLWRGRPAWDVGTARADLADAVALVGLCFWPLSYPNDNGREIGVSPWAAPASPRCTGCQNEIDLEMCWCGGRIGDHWPTGDHSPVPMGCDCGRSIR